MRSSKLRNMNNRENHIALMAIYRQEWIHRAQTFREIFWKMIYLSLAITFLPNILEAVNVNNNLVKHLPVWAFSIGGIMCVGFGMFLD